MGALLQFREADRLVAVGVDPIHQIIDGTVGGRRIGDGAVGEQGRGQHLHALAHQQIVEP
jgi:hypothetical protein